MHVEPGNNYIAMPEEFILQGWEKDGVTYYFLPSFEGVLSILQNDPSSTGIIYTMDGTVLSHPLYGEIQEVEVDFGDGNKVPWKIAFLRSENLYTVYINLRDGDVDGIEHDTYTPSELSVYSPNGKLQYYEKNNMIKGRGNSTWKTDKRPYEINLPQKYPLCGLASSSKWTLLANAYDDTKMLNKMTMDMASDMGMEYASESSWVDLYINGEYQGNYLVCHEPDIGNGGINVTDLEPYNDHFITDATITEKGSVKGYDYPLRGRSVPEGGYLIEKILFHRYKNRRCGFKENENCFAVKSPNNALLDEVSYLRDYIEEVDDTIHGNSTEQLSMIDLYSFARLYLIEEISFNPDFGFSSGYYYKKPGDNKLYAGPCWDFDMAYGRRNEVLFRDYTSGIFDGQQYFQMIDGYIPLDWDRVLMSNIEYNDYVKQIFCECIPIYDRLLSDGIDDYYRLIYDSICMDYIRWNGIEDYDRKVWNSNRYLRFFLYHRLKHIADINGVGFTVSEPDIYDDSTHSLEFIYDNGSIVKMAVEDGAQMQQDELPEYDHSLYDGWRIGDESFAMLSYYDPIFEDMTLVLDGDDIDEL